MSITSDLIDQAMRVQEDVWGNETMLYRGWHVPCVFSDQENGLELQLGGKVETIRGTVFVRRSAITSSTVDSNEDTGPDTPLSDNDFMPPHTGKLVVIRSKRYRMLDTKLNGEVWRVVVGSPER